MLMKRFEEKNLIKWASFGLVWAWLLMVSILQSLFYSPQQTLGILRLVVFSCIPVRYFCIFLFQSVVQNTTQFCIVIIPHCIFQVVINLIITSSLTVSVADADSGKDRNIPCFYNSFYVFRGYSNCLHFNVLLKVGP